MTSIALECLKNPAIIAQFVRKLPPSAREKWLEMLYPIDGDAISDENKPAKFISFVRWQLNISDEMAALKESVPKPKVSNSKFANTRGQSSQNASNYNSILLVK